MQIEAILQRLQFKRPVVGLFGIKPYLGILEGNTADFAPGMWLNYLCYKSNFYFITFDQSINTFAFLLKNNASSC